MGGVPLSEVLKKLGLLFSTGILEDTYQVFVYTSCNLGGTHISLREHQDGIPGWRLQGFPRAQSIRLAF